MAKGVGESGTRVEIDGVDMFVLGVKPCISVEKSKVDGQNNKIYKSADC